MLKERIITAAILILAVLLTIFWASSTAFAWITAAVVLLAAWEWSALSDATHIPTLWKQSPTHIKGVDLGRAIYVILFIPLLWLYFYVPSNLTVGLSIIFWLVAFTLIFQYPNLKPAAKGFVARSTSGMIVLIPFWVGINALFNADNGRSLLLYALVLVFVADTAAYFAGKFYGKKPLAPHVSPGKTVEGLIAQVIASGLFAIALAPAFAPTGKGHWFILLSLVTVLFSVVGDLFESVMKRQKGVKDSGDWLPGHGGILDRIDSLTAAIPVFALGCYWMGLI